MPAASGAEGYRFEPCRGCSPRDRHNSRRRKPNRLRRFALRPYLAPAFGLASAPKAEGRQAKMGPSGASPCKPMHPTADWIAPRRSPRTKKRAPREAPEDAVIPGRWAGCNEDILGWGQLRRQDNRRNSLGGTSGSPVLRPRPGGRTFFPAADWPAPSRMPDHERSVNSCRPCRTSCGLPCRGSVLPPS